jgi:succinate-acetate transporter protein
LIKPAILGKGFCIAAKSIFFSLATLFYELAVVLFYARVQLSHVRSSLLTLANCSIHLAYVHISTMAYANRHFDFACLEHLLVVRYQTDDNVHINE